MPQHYATPVLVSPQVWNVPAARAENVTDSTVMVAVPLFPSLVAVIVALPWAIAVTRPLDDTDAFVASELLHVTVRPDSTALPASSVVAVSCCVAPTNITAGTVGETTTLAT